MARRPTPARLRRAVALELAAAAGGATLFLAIVPARPVVVDVALALCGLALVGAAARDTRARIWSAVAPAAGDRRRWDRALAGSTLAAALVFAAHGAVRPGDDPAGAGARLFTPTLVATLILFIPWALLQQTLFQFHLLGRLAVLLDAAPTPIVIAVNGVLFGLVHLPDWDVVLVTIVGGGLWSAHYHRVRRIVPVALSHAALGTAYFHWVRGEDLARRWLGLG
jgi:hypothetical protein